jgi:ribonuclease-3
MALFGRRTPNPYLDLEKRIGYRFRNRALLEEALTHRSYRFENPDIEADNQRLEFLGDAVLGAVASAYLFSRHPTDDEGALTERRSRLTSGKALAETARRLLLGEFLRVGKGEDRSGGRQRPTNLADALESVIGAAFVDGGTRAVERIFAAVFAEEDGSEAVATGHTNPKGALQMASQQRWKVGPTYRVVDAHGPPHATLFTVEVTLASGATARGTGWNKQDAERHAAMEALRDLTGRSRPDQA